jgi:membrane fusion protein (multidrug efflux system)
MVLGLAALAACGGEPVADTHGGAPVVTSGVTITDLAERIEATGQLLAQERAAIASEVAGRVTDVLVEEGAEVEAGQVLLAIDPERRELELRDARAGLAQAEAAWKEATREHERVRQLHGRGIASEARLDAVGTEAALARSRHEAALARAGVAERALRDASVSAPFAGWVARRHVSRGEYVQVGQPLFELVSLDPIEVEFHVAERDSARVAEGQEVQVQVAPFPEEAFTGRVTVISPTIDERTRTLRVKARVANADRRLRPGLFAKVDLGVALQRDVLLVPEEAVLQRADGQVVFRARPQERVERVLVTTGRHRDGLVEITSGLAAGDVVVTRGQSALVDGARVSPRNPDGTSPGTELSAAEPSAIR